MLSKPRVHGDVAGAVATTLQALGQDQVFEVGGVRPERSTAAATMGLATSIGSILASEALRAVPIALRAAAMIAALLLAAMCSPRVGVYV